MNNLAWFQDSNSQDYYAWGKNDFVYWCRYNKIKNNYTSYICLFNLPLGYSDGFTSLKTAQSNAQKHHDEVMK